MSKYFKFELILRASFQIRKAFALKRARRACYAGPVKSSEGQAAGKTLKTLAPKNVPYQTFLLVQQMTRRFQQLLTPYDLTPLHWGVLSCLWVEDGLRPSDIAQRLEQHGGTITVGLTAMTRRGLISRRRNPEDRREFRIYLTSKGQQLRLPLEKEVHKLLAQIFSVLKPEQLNTFEATLATLRQHLQS